MAEALRSNLRDPGIARREISRPKPQAGATPLDGLPPTGTRHWVPRYKAAVVTAVNAGVLTLDDARRRYLLSEEEFCSWRDTIERYGIVGLRMSVSERRGPQRLQVSERGEVSLHAGERADCIIVDVSDRGARLELDGRISLPNLFELHCGRSGRSWWVELVWQRGEKAGVAFSNPLPPPWRLEEGLGDWLIGRREAVAIDRRD